MEDLDKFIEKYKILILGLIISVAYWFIESLIDLFFFSSGKDYISLCFTPDLHELWMRISGIAFIIIFSIISYYFYIDEKKLKQKVEQAEQRIKEALNHSSFYKDLLTLDMGNIFNNLKVSTKLRRMWKGDPIKSDMKEEMMEIIKQQLERGVSLISNVRKISEAEEGEKVIKSVNVKITLENAIEHVSSRFLEKEIEIKSEMPGSFNVKGGDLLIDAFENLLINGAIHNDSDNIQLGVKISKVQEEGEKLIKIEFEDNGIGIIEERKKVIFNRDYKKDRRTGGMGIGLLLVKKIIDGYDGRVWVENRVEGGHAQGSNFIILLEEA